MKRALLLLVALLAPAVALAAPGGGPAPSAAPAAPTGHPGPLPAGADTGAMPVGHPHVDEGAGPMGDTQGLYRPPQDTSNEDDKLAEGTIRVTILDPDDKPMPQVDVTLGVLQQSVAKGESRKHVNATTGPSGDAIFHDLTVGSDVAYRVSVARDSATFAATPFQLHPLHGVHVSLHVFPTTHDIRQATVFLQGALFVDVKDDRVQVQQIFRVSNYGKVAWVPNDVVLQLPEGFSAFNASQQMSDQGFDSMPQGANLRGTFGAGESDIGFSWQLPYSGASDVSFEVTMPPHLASLVVRAAASGQVKLDVQNQAADGWKAFPPPEPDRDEQGNRLLVTGLQAKPDEAAIKRVRVAVHDLPTPGMGRWVATALAIFGVALGIALAATPPEKKAKGDGKSERARWLAELEELEKAFGAGDVGPKTYERARREIIDGLARSLAKGGGKRAS